FLLSHSPLTHRHSPSFPTRRSSDLASNTRDRQPCAPGRATRLANFARRSPQSETAANSPGEDYRNSPDGPCRRPTRDHIAAVGTDRKSTRLNSSHSQISYAVFCLKK